MDELKEHDPRLPPQLAEIATIHFVSFIVGKHPELLSDYFVKELGRCRDRKEVECFQQNSVPKITVPGMINYCSKDLIYCHKLLIQAKLKFRKIALRKSKWPNPLLTIPCEKFSYGIAYF